MKSVTYLLDEYNALPIAVTSYKIESLLTAVGSRKQVPPGLESNQYATQESI